VIGNSLQYILFRNVLRAIGLRNHRSGARNLSFFITFSFLIRYNYWIFLIPEPKFFFPWFTNCEFGVPLPNVVGLFPMTHEDHSWMLLT
jgi:hypothetical protein